jgi:hypothetical protein
MSAPVPVVRQLRNALLERTRLENDFKTRILNRINDILRQLQDCDRASLPPTAAGVLNIAIADLDAIVRDISNPTNMTDRDVEQIVEPLQRRNRDRTLRLLPAGQNIDGDRSLSAPPTYSSLFPSSSAPASSRPWSSWFSSAPPARGSSVSDDLEEPSDDSVNGANARLPGPFGLGRSPLNGSHTGSVGGKRTRRKYHRKA